MAAGPSSTRVRTAARSHSPSPASMVSCSCRSTSSSSLSATAMPPCAYSEEDSRRLSLATTSTRPAVSQFDSGAQAGDAGADDKKVRIHCVCDSMSLSYTCVCAGTTD